MVSVFHKLMRPYVRRLYQMITRGKVGLVNDGGALQTLQVTSLGGTRDYIERLQQYGLAGNPPAGAEALLVSICGSGDHSVAVAVEHRRYRLKGLKNGEVAIYDDQEQMVKLSRDGIVIESAKKVTVNCGEINLGGGREALQALVDQRFLQLFNSHTHPVNGSTTAAPVQPAMAAAVCTDAVKAG